MVGAAWRWLALVLATMLATSAVAEDYRLGDLVLRDPWMRATPPGAPVAGGYLEITNTGTRPARLTGGEADFAARVEIHRMSMEGGVMRMRELTAGLAIPPGRTVALAPGGEHVMFMGLDARLVQGEHRRATLRFAETGEVAVTFRIAGLGATAPPAE